MKAPVGSVMWTGSTLHVLAALLFAVSAACGTAVPAARPPLTRPTQTEAPLGPGDTFEVSVYGEKDLSGKYRVANDGTINFPLVGSIAVAGLRAPEVANRIREALISGEILRAPTVSVEVTEQISKRITVLGAVKLSGGYPLIAGMTALQAITAAGGLTPVARGDSVVLTRRVNGVLKRFKVPVESITEGQAEDVPLQAGDILFVPDRIF